VTYSRARIREKRNAEKRGPIEGKVINGILIKPYLPRDRAQKVPKFANVGYENGNGSSGRGYGTTPGTSTETTPPDISVAILKTPETPPTPRSYRLNTRPMSGRSSKKHSRTPIKRGEPYIGRGNTDMKGGSDDDDEIEVISLLDDDDDDDMNKPTGSCRSSPRYTREAAPAPSRKKKTASTHDSLFSLTTSASRSPPSTPPPILRSTLTLPPPAEPPFSSSLESGALRLRYPRGATVQEGHKVQGGDTILKTEALYKVLHSRHLATHCSGCFMSPEHKVLMDRITSVEDAQKTYLTCRCGIARFCSAVSGDERGVRVC
jgi:hypothetical protein